MNDALGLSARLDQFHRLLGATEVSDRRGKAIDRDAGMAAAVDLLAATAAAGAAVYLAGNGGSAAIVSHVQTDLVNAVGMRAYTVHESSLLTCMANDHGYGEAFARIVERLAEPRDLLIAVSSSGRSPNLLEAVRRFAARGGKAMTLTGFGADNPLRQLGEINLWLDVEDYGLVEVGHQFLLHNLTDRLRDRLRA